uniref:Vacuolar protein sorting-associated protein 29 n=1 Tax=Haptolina brevifila TaxID=156173 RepID=A0A7S2JKV8_9EUKA|mmetsp:Transcript_8431/g.17064  ORF Transcript_8431/g.17064 Transcript_8431/m.17064 type:complete len:248 (+) Transcript_8431:101-844(+)
MVLVLVIGDMHVPHRKADLPKKFKALLQPGKIQHILCTGNVVDKLTYDYLRSLATDVHVVRGICPKLTQDAHVQTVELLPLPHTLAANARVCVPVRASCRYAHPQVRGDFDDGTFLPVVADSLPETKVVKIGQFQLGLCHGHQVVPWGDQEALGALQRQLDCDILVTGHTHCFTAYEAEGKLFINPGSATGAFSPSFQLGEEPTPSFVLMDVQQTRVVIYVYELVGEEVKVKKIEHAKAPAAGVQVA